MADLSDFELGDKLYESSRSLVCRALERRTGRAVVLKLLEHEYPSPEELSRYRQEFEVTRALDFSAVIDVYEQFEHNNSLVMVVEDFGGESLARHMAARRFTVEEALELGVGIAEALAQIHAAQVIHKDINPSNLVYCRASERLAVIDFGISTRLDRERPSFTAVSEMRGTMAYMSPEQTGRMNRHVDYRTDFYSLGVTLYELLCGRRPFTTDDPVALIHCHLARQPEPPHELEPEVPAMASAIVLKLMAKMADDRYKSGWGIAADLRACLERVRAGAAEPEGEAIELGRHDSAIRLELPQHLYGRAREVELLERVFAQARQGQAELVMVRGYSGIGKTSLVQELHRSVSMASGVYVAGKFDQLQRVPYGAWVEALGALIHRLLGEREAAVERWRERLLAALGADAQLMVELIPELELIIGPQLPAAELGAHESNLRFQRILGRFIGVFCAAEHPLLLVLDDLQWADTPSLNLLESLMLGDEIEHLLIVGAYRDNEVDAVHPLRAMLDELAQHGRNVHDLALANLELEHVVELLVDTLGMAAAEVMPLAALFRRKTGGNPFFVRQLLHSLDARGLLVFESEAGAGRWRWDVAAIEALGLSDNLIELMIAKLEALPGPCREALRVAACFGNRFDLGSLALVEASELADMFAALEPAARAGFIVPTSELMTVRDAAGELALVHHEFRFLHDRVQQAAYALLDADARAELHARIGWLLLDHLDEDARDRRLFELVDHFARGVTPEEHAARARVAELAAAAARKAKHSTAFGAAATYARAAIELLGPERWVAHYPLSYELALVAAEVELVLGDYDALERTAAEALAEARDLLDKTAMQLVLITERSILSKYGEAIELGLDALAWLGIELERDDLDGAVVRQSEALEHKLAAKLEGRPLASLSELPACESALHARALTLLASTVAACYLDDPRVMALVSMKLIDVSLEHGNHGASATGYLSYGMVLGGAFGDYTRGYAFARLGLALAQRFDDRAQIARAATILVSMVGHWARPFAELEALVKPGFQAGLEVADEYTNYMLCNSAQNCFISGMGLERLDARLTSALDHLDKTKNPLALMVVHGLQMVVANLRGDGESGEVFAYAGEDEASYFPAELREQVAYAAANYAIFQAQVMVYDRRYAAARARLDYAAERMLNIQGAAPVVEYYFYRGLIAAAEGADLDTLDESIARLTHFSAHCPENNRHKLLALEAERARVKGELVDAIEGYDAAIEEAAAQGFVQNEALFNRLAADLWQARGRPRIAESYLLDAGQAFQRWGARRLASELERAYPHVFTRRGWREGEPREVSTSTTTTGELGVSLDLEVAVAACRAIANESDLARLLVRVMSLSLESAGAERGLLILERDGELYVKATGDSLEDPPVSLVSTELAVWSEVPAKVVHYVVRTKEPLILDDATQREPFASDPYIQRTGCQSMLCLPLLNQGALTGVVYVENRAAVGAFTHARIGVLELLLTPAAMAIENASLRAGYSQREFDYQVGGSLGASANSYVTRRADRELDAGLRAGAFCYVFGPRQMGKSSLRVHAARRFREAGTRCVSVDLSMIGSDGIRADQWYAGVARALVTGLGLEREFGLRSWWRERAELSNPQRLYELLADELLPRRSTPLLVMFDEIDSLGSLPFSTDDFFAMLRALFERRTERPELEGLNFVVLGVTSPSRLVKDLQRTPFNIGRRVPLQGFRGTEAKVLEAGLIAKGDAATLLALVLSWTNGQPFLTQKLCALIRDAESSPAPGRESSWVARLVLTKMIERWEEHDDPLHFKTIQGRLLGSELGCRGLLERYRRVLAEREAPALAGDAVDAELVLSGLVVQDRGKLAVGNRIYEAIFNDAWVAAQLASDPL